MGTKYQKLVPKVIAEEYWMYNQSTPEMKKKMAEEKKQKLLSNRMSRSKYVVGTTVRKKFGKKWFVGSVVDYSPVDGHYKIIYEDGDQEQFDDVDMEEYLYKPNNNNKNQELQKNKKQKK